ncbi:MAG TPA: DUF1080 domain-containing protein [Thermoflexia bacterium]|nr:DUF1080 domain-containing protein [Thermoflexia bacterium]
MSKNSIFPISPDYRDRVYAGWLGKCIGVHFGGPLESWSYQDIRDNLGAVEGYLQPPGKVFKPDDDLVMPLIMMRALEDSPDPGRLTAQEIGTTWLNYLSQERGAIWRGGYGVSSEHTAYLNLLHDIPAPQSGSAALNGQTVAEQIGGQIFSDIWGLVYPNDPPRAADLAEKATSISHDGEGINGGRFVAALVSAAFSESDPEDLIETALTVIPPDSEYARVVRAMVAWHAQQPGNWRAAREYVEREWGYSRYLGIVPIIPNAAVIVLALLYGGGDFSRSIQIANMCGWDTDCNVGNVGAVLGVAVGLEGIPEHWRVPLNDLIVSSSIIGGRNIADIPATADFLSRKGRILAGETFTDAALPRYNFDYPGSTHGLLVEKRRCRVALLQQSTEWAFCGRGSLRVTIDRLNRKGEVRLFTRTHYRVDELSSNHYEACFSPRIYPGQRVTVQVYLPAGAPGIVHTSLFVRDRVRNLAHQSPGTKLLPGQWNQLSLALPAMEDVCLSEVGLVVRSLGEDPWSGVLHVDALDWDGPPNYNVQLGTLLPNGKTTTGWTTHCGYWRVENGAYSGSGGGQNESYTGDVAWQDYQITVQLQPVLGERHCVNVRVQGALSSYAAGLVAGERVALCKKQEGHYRELASAPFPWRHGELYTLTIVASGNAISLSANGKQLLQVTDGHAPYSHGQIGLSNGAGCHTRFLNLQVAALGA